MGGRTKTRSNRNINKSLFCVVHVGADLSAGLQSKARPTRVRLSTRREKRKRRKEKGNERERREGEGEKDIINHSQEHFFSFFLVGQVALALILASHLLDKRERV
jgi:hypothetical protein